MNGSHTAHRVIWTLLLLAPVLGELLSTSSPPAEYLKPVSFVMLTLLYGGGALLCREAMVRTGSGWRGLLWLGAAYGIVEEAFICQSWFNTSWPDLGALAHFGRFLGVSWMWALHLTAFHAAISIAVTVLIVDLMYPSAVGIRLLSERGWRGAAGLFTFIVGLLHLGFSTTYRAPWTHLAGGLALAACCVYWGTRPTTPTQPEAQPALSERTASHLKLGLLGAVISWSMLLYGFASPRLGLTPPAAIAVYLALGGFWAHWLVRLTHFGRRWNRTGRAALVSGVLSFPVFACLIAERMPRPDNPAGLGMVGLIAVIMLALLIRHSRYLDSLEATSGALPYA